MAAAWSFAYSYPPSALSTALAPAQISLLICERRSAYDLSQARSEPGAPEPTVPDSLPALDVVELYFDDAIRNGRSSLLGHQEEIELAQAIEAGRRAAAELSAEKCTSSRARSLKHIIQYGDQARELLITANLRLVVSVATWYRNSTIPLADLIQDGNIGLVQAVDKYDWRRGTRFSTYAVWWIRQAIARSLANHSRLIRIPVHAHQKLAMIARSSKVLYQESGVDPTPAQIAKNTGLSEVQVRDLMPYLHPPTSLEAPIETENGLVTSLAAIAQDPEMPSIEEQAGRQIAHEALQRALESLTPREHHLLTRRYGLRGDKRLSLRAAGEALGLTKGQAQALEANALHKLRSQTSADRREPV